MNFYFKDLCNQIRLLSIQARHQSLFVHRLTGIWNPDQNFKTQCIDGSLVAATFLLLNMYVCTLLI